MIQIFISKIETQGDWGGVPQMKINLKESTKQSLSDFEMFKILYCCSIKSLNHFTELTF